MRCNPGVAQRPAARPQPFRINAQSGEMPAGRALRPLAERRMVVGIVLLHLARVLAEMPGDHPEQKERLASSGRTVEVDAGCELLETKLIDGVFPDDRRLLQSPPAHRTELPRKALILGPQP